MIIKRYPWKTHWFFACCSGSSLYTYIFVKNINSNHVFHFNLNDFLLINAVVFIFSLIVTIPYIILYKKILENSENLSVLKLHILVNFILFLLLLIVFVISYYLMRSAIDSLELIFSFGLPGLITVNLFFIKFEV